MMQRRPHHQRGFTIVELMIATSVSAILILVLTFAIVQMGRLYYKGFTQSRTQQTARSVMDTISQAVQLSPATVSVDPTNPPAYVCVGSRAYNFSLGQQVDSGHKALSYQDISGGCSSAAHGSLAAGQGLLSDGMRLGKFAVTQISPPGSQPEQYSIDVTVAYGDSDLLCDTTVGHCNDNVSLGATTPVGPNSVLQCKNIRSGSQFCAVSQLSTVVERRMN